MAQQSWLHFCHQWADKLSCQALSLTILNRYSPESGSVSSLGILEFQRHMKDNIKINKALAILLDLITSFLKHSVTVFPIRIYTCIVRCITQTHTKGTSMKNIHSSDNATFFKVKWIAGVIHKEHECYPKSTQDIGGLWSLQKTKTKNWWQSAWYFYFLGINTNTINSWLGFQEESCLTSDSPRLLEVTWMPPKTCHLLHLHYALLGEKRGRDFIAY